MNLGFTSRRHQPMLAIWFALITATPCLGNTFTAYGPQTYKRNEGTPITVRTTFEVRNPSTQYFVRLRTDRVASALVSVNGVTVIDPTQFNQNVTNLETPITLRAVNEVVVQVRGGPGGAIILEIVGVDNDPPTINATATPPPDGNGWNNSNVNVTFTCADVTSGIATCPPAVMVSTEGRNQLVAGTAIDKAGNTATASATVSIDTTPPIVTATQLPSANANGWNNGPVTVHFACSDVGSGVASCPDDQVLSAEGGNQIASGAVTDKAGNTVTASTRVSIDRTPPALTITSPAAGAMVLTSGIVTKATVTDALSGVAGVACNGAPATVAGAEVECALVLTPGANAINVVATDRAGNTSSTTLSVTYARTLTPKVTITSPSNLSYTNISPTTITGTVDDATATVTVNSIQVPVANGYFTLALPLAEGPNTVTATAISGSGTAGTASVVATLDTTPPHVTITSPPDGFVTTDGSISVAGSVNDIVVGTVNDQQAQVAVNGGAAQVANRMFLAVDVPLALGPNLIRAVGTDRVGNAATTQITVTRQAAAAQPKIRLVSGNHQVGMIGSVLAEPLVIALEDASGAPISGKSVIFKVTQNDGTVSGGGKSGPTAIVPTDAQGQAHVQWTLGMRAGAGGNSIDAYAVGVAGTAVFTATGALGQPGKIVIDTGNAQTGALGEPLPKPFIAVVIDSGNNRLAGVPVTFTVKQGGGTFDTQPAITLVTDSDGRVAATLTLGTQEGNANNIVEATFPDNQSSSAGFVASGRAPGDPARTTISGVVLDNSNRPIPGVTMRAVLTNVLNANGNAVQLVPAVQTDAQGQFTIPQAPVGAVKLLADGLTAQLPGVYPSLEYDLVTVAGQNTTVGQPIYLLPLETSNQVCVTATSGGGTLTIPDSPGFSLTLGPGQVTFPGGSKTGCVSVTVVHGDKVPMMPGFGQQPRFIVTIQPAGAVFNPPAPITLPNVDGLKPRAVTEMYSFDHDIGSFVAIGTGVVSADGQIIRSSAGVGVLKAGWHCGGNPAAAGTVADCPTCQSCTGTQCVPDDSHKPPEKCASCDNGTPVPPKTVDQCCQELTVPNDVGWVLCCNGTKVSCVDPTRFPPGTTGLAEAIGLKCARVHEGAHFDQTDACPTGRDECETTRPHFTDSQNVPDAECSAFRLEVFCLEFSKLSDCASDGECRGMVDSLIISAKIVANRTRSGCFP
jgi:hypothetical protein